jgi:Kelch motif
VHGGQDLKEGCFGDMWKLNIDFLYAKQGTLEQDQDMQDGTEIEGATWKQVNITGSFPAKLAHHQGVLQEHTKEFIIYGGIRGLDSSDTLYVVDLKTFKFTAITADKQKEVNGKPLPGPRDDFCLISFQGEQPRTKPVYLIGGFKNGSKMNDVYRLNQNGAIFTWEFIDIPARNKPEPRSSFAACLASDTKFYLFGGSGDNNVKYNDLWECDLAPTGANWTELHAGSPPASDHEQSHDKKKPQDQLPL